MIRGFYTALSGIVATMTRQSVVADNIANVDTVGFKQSRSTQSDFGFDLGVSTGGDLGRLGTATMPTNLLLDRSQGPLVQTDVQTDLAIEGDGLFTVRTASGVAYTRAGNFQQDATGMLVTEQGFPILDTAGRTITPPSQFTVTEDGTIPETGQRIALVAWPADGIYRLGQNLYGASGQLPPATGKVHQRMLENSNTELSVGMTELVSLQRSFQLASRALSLQDGTLGEAVTLGRLK